MRLSFLAVSLAVLAPVVQAQTPPPSARAAAKFTLDTPIAVLLADPRAKVVVEETLPGLTSRPNFERAKGMSLRQIQRATNGRLTDDKLRKAEQRLAAIR